LETTTLLDGSSFQIGSFPVRSSLLQGNESLVTAIIFIRAVENPIDVEALIRRIALDSSIILSRIQGAQNI
jgi:hypothetical protein